MGQPVVHFEIIGKDAEKLKAYYEALFGWNIDSNNPINYGIVPPETNVSGEGVGIGGGIAAGPEGYAGHVTFYVAVPDFGMEAAEINPVVRTMRAQGWDSSCPTPAGISAPSR